ncbi:hypothetical protein GTY78_25665 [Streptomyces sp. SID4934]|nr:hypothetical protein [Streptomyces sp. SID4934]SCE40819.1 Transglutaminase-like superfamily protein [Streptomyces sp. ScaeMP-6W]
MEISLATVIALALCGRPAHRVLGARQWPTEAHAWVWTENGVFGLSGRDRVDLRRPLGRRPRRTSRAERVTHMNENEAPSR